MTRCHAHQIFPVICLLALAAAGVAAGSQIEWNTRLETCVGSIGGAPQDVNARIGVVPGATDEYDPGIDMSKPPLPPGRYVWEWFNRPAWGKGDIVQDYRSEIAEATGKVWDDFRVKARVTQDPSGVDPCGFGDNYPIASAIYLTWVFGTGDKAPPADYEFTLQYKRGINAKPVDTVPEGVTVPTINQTWDMKAVDHIVFPLWDVQFYPWDPSCSFQVLPDTAEFRIVVTNPGTLPTCTILANPDSPQRPPATFTFTASACCDKPFTFSWDFGDGATGAGNPVAHTYSGEGAYVITCTMTDAGGQVAVCDTTVNVVLPRLIHVDCNATCADPDGTPECPYHRVQDGIDAAIDGDTVMVLPCTYCENIDFLGKAITVTSTDPLDTAVVAATVIDGGGVREVVRFTSGEAPSSVLRGLTTQNGATGWGGIWCEFSSPTITNNIITANATGIVCQFSSPTITSNTVARNCGSGILCSHSSVTISNNTIARNDGRGIDCVSSAASITNNTVTENSTPWEGGGIRCSLSSPAISNNIVAFNSSGIWQEDSTPILRNNCVYNPDGYDYAGLAPGEGDFSADPLFVDRSAGDYHLRRESPCIDAGWNDAPGLPDNDIDGDPRPWPAGGVVDIGADEWVNQPPACHITYEPIAPAVNQHIAFHANAHDPDGAPVACSWDFGDGTSAIGCDPAHAYPASGTYIVSVTVADADGSAATCHTEVAVIWAGEADCEIVRIRAAPRGRARKRHHIVVMLRNWGPDSCRAQVRLRNLGTNRIIEERIVDLRTAGANGRPPMKVETFSHRWQPADVGWSELEVSVMPLNRRDPRLQNNSAFIAVRVRR